MVKEPEAYRRSSSGVHAHGKHDDLIDKYILYGKRSGDETIKKEHRKFVQRCFERKRR